jgi:DNA-binding response OmpR family regulator
VQRHILTVLLIEDSPEYAHLVEHWLSGTCGDTGFDLNWRSTLAAAIARLGKGDVDVILLDLGLPDCQGFETYARTRACAPNTPIVVLGSSDLDSVSLGMIREGAEDYLIKSSCGAEVLMRAVRYARQSTVAACVRVVEAPAKIVIQAPKELPRELVSDYLEDCGNNLIGLQAAVIKRDYKHARLVGHGMKGTGSPYGFPALTQLGAAIEQAATSEEAPELEKQVDRLTEYLGRLELAR